MKVNMKVSNIFNTSLQILCQLEYDKNQKLEVTLYYQIQIPIQPNGDIVGFPQTGKKTI